jgi:hypothetical protein
VFAESALGIVEQDVGFECPTLAYAKPQREETPPDFPKLAWEPQLDFDFDFQSDTLNCTLVTRAFSLSGEEPIF